MSQSFRTFMFWVGLLFVVAPVTTVVLRGMGVPQGFSALGGIAAAASAAVWRSRRSKNSTLRGRTEETAHADALAEADRTRAASPWMDDPDDYRPLPQMPELASLPDDVANEYVRKYNLRKEAAKHVDREIAEEKVLNGTKYTPEQREVLIQRECRQAQFIKEQVACEVGREQADRRRAKLDHAETLDAIESSTAFGAAKKFQKEHPFLAGVIGAEVVHQMKKK
jgi:hypothetical protein